LYDYSMTILYGIILLILGIILLKGFWIVYKKLNSLQKKWVNFSIFSLIFILIFLSLLTYRTGSLPNENFGGPLGYYISKYLISGFGIGSYILPFIILIAGISFFAENYFENFFIWSGFLLGYFFSLELLFTLNEKYSGEFNKAVYGWMRNHFGMGGVYLIILLLFFVSSGFLYLYISKNKARKKKLPVRQKPQKKKVKVIEKPLPDESVEMIKEEIDKDFYERYLSIFSEPTEVFKVDEGEKRMLAQKLEEKLADFDINGTVSNIISGPVITRFEYEPAPGIKLSKISNLSNDLALALKAHKIRIVAPIPGKGAVGIEIPNKKRSIVYIRDFLEKDTFRKNLSRLFIPIGEDIPGTPYFDDIGNMPHLLVAGATGSGKSVFINSVLVSILSKSSPQDVRLIMVDPKRIELSIYNGIPHLLKPVIIEPKEALETLREGIAWMELRYKEFARAGVRDIDGYNNKMKEKKPYILIVIDELADLMMTSGREIEDALIRLAQMARAVGIHLIIATQRPSVDVITGLIKANFPARISFQVASRHDSSTILDTTGAEKLLGKGDMLYLPSGKGNVIRLHGAFVSTEEAKSVANLWGSIHLKKLLKGKLKNYLKIVELLIEEDMLDTISNPSLPGSEERCEVFFNLLKREMGNEDVEKFKKIIEEIDYFSPIEEILIPKPAMAELNKNQKGNGEDELFGEAKRLVITYRTASVSFLQRKLKIGYARAGRLIDALEKAGIVGPYKGSKAREVLTKGE